jgi:thymidylate kinase
MHIAIEGIDGVGKTTAATGLADRLNFKIVEKPLHYLFDEGESTDNYIRIRDEVNANTNKIFTGWFYGLGNIFLYEQFKNQNIITDRHILSNYCWSGSDESDFVFDAIYRAIGHPDYTFIIYAPPEVVAKRLLKRDVNDSDLKKVSYVPEAYEKMIRIMKKYDMPGTVVDTSDMNEKEVVDYMIDVLKEKGIIDAE